MRRDARQQSVSEVSVASAVKWLQRWYQQEERRPRSRAAGSVSPLEEFAVEIFGSDRPTAG